MDEEQQEKAVAKPDKSRVCDLCGRDFSSGKALGGHMRIHITKKMDNPNPKLRKSYSDGFDQCKVVKDEPEPICFACGKRFPSMKSLFGHMRSHPERGWRGIHPPSSKLNPPPSSCKVSDSNRVSSDINDQIASVFGTDSGSRPVPAPVTPDLSRSLSSWPVTAKRGRKSLASVAHSGSGQDLESELVHEAFMMLADKNRLHSSAPKDQKSVGTDPACSNFEMNEDNLKNREDLAKIEQESVEEETDDSGEEQRVCIELMRKLKKRKKRKLRDLESISVFDNTLNKYKCASCNKSFSTHQALGGHVSSHNKLLKTSHDKGADEAVASRTTRTNWVDSDRDNGDNNDNAVAIAGQEEFKTSPAAVGSSEPALSSVTCDKASPSYTMSRKLLDFDLNELPPMDEDEEVMEPEGVAVGPLAVYAST